MYSGPKEDVAKLEFLQSLHRLSGAPIPVTDVYWSQFWLVPDAAAEITGLLPSDAIRNALISSSENVCTLLAAICSHLFQLLTDPRLIVTASSSVASVRSYFAGNASITSQEAKAPDLHRQVLNCVRVLSRVLPIVYERNSNPSNEDERNSYQDLFWVTQKEASPVPEIAKEDQFVIDDEEEEETDNLQQSPEKASAETGGTTLGQRLHVSTLPD